MDTVYAGLVLLPRFTTLVGATSFTTAPVDLSQQGGAQFMVWRGPIRVSSGSGTLTLFMEESLDGHSWTYGPLSPESTGTLVTEGDPQFFSYSVRLRWFRLRLTLAGTNPMVSCWAEGLLRGGAGPGGVRLPAGAMDAFGSPLGRGPEVQDPWEKLRARYDVIRRMGTAGWYPGLPDQLHQAQMGVAQEWARLHPGMPLPPAPPMPSNPWIASAPQHEEMLKGK